MKRIIVDIDGTICYDTGGEYKKAKPMLGKIKYFNNLYDSGKYEIIYWTARGGNTGRDWEDLTKEQLDKWGVKRHELWMNKPPYDYWIDDKSINPVKFHAI